jgi:succinate-semialdehyde dehydrogenase/glutarate-semialdehyde dehydrogenase
MMSDDAQRPDLQSRVTVAGVAEAQALEEAAISSTPKQLYLGGDWVSPSEGGQMPVTDPATGARLCEVASASAADAIRALDMAAAAQADWAKRPPRVRGELLRQAFERLTVEAERFALLIALENGKPLPEARSEVSYAAEFLRWYSEEAVRLEGGYRPAPLGGARVLTFEQPVGPCVLITPWNFPLAMATRKVAPAIAAGCTMILKPAHQTPLTALAFAELLQRCDLPHGVLSVLPTNSSAALVSPLLGDVRMRKVSFTGSTEVGRALTEQAARNLMRVSMELGGNAPFVVFADADLERALDGAVQAKMRNTGESCTAANRFFVEEEIAESFTRGLADRLGQMRLGRGTEPGVEVGPLIDDDAVRRLGELAEEAATDGAEVALAGGQRPGPGHFFKPGVVFGASSSSRLRTEELFGPLAAIWSFRGEEEAIEVANETAHGLVSFVHTRDLDRALRVSEEIDCGMVGLNRGMVSEASAPFGGTKLSGLGREGGREGLREYLETKYVSIAS